MNKKFIIEIECDGDIDVEGMENLIEDMLNNQVNCTEMFFNVTETKQKQDSVGELKGE